MKLETWENWYNKILDDFGFLKEEDEKSALILNRILNDKGSYSLDGLKKFINESKEGNTLFIIFGAGPSLKDHVNYFKNNPSKFDNYVTIAADGATTALLEENIIPDIIVTDLDGKIDDLLIANEKGSFFVIHAHGNNQESILKYVKSFKKVLGTTQSNPFGKLYNFGGFTDGDRGVFLAIALNVKTLCLAGMDFGKYVTSYSRPNLSSDIEIADDIKQKKLNYAEKLVKWASKNTDVDISFMKSRKN